MSIGIPAQDIQPIAQWRQRIAQLVGQGRQELILPAVGFPQRLGLRLQLVALFGDLLALPIQLEEHLGLAAQDVRLDRLLNEVDGAGLVAAKPALVVGAAGGHENDRNPSRALGAAHQFGQLEAIQARHLHVDQRQRDVVL